MFNHSSLSGEIVLDIGVFLVCNLYFYSLKQFHLPQ